MKFENICIHYFGKIKQSDEYDSVKPVRSADLLLPDFYNTLVYCFNEYQKKYPGHRAYITESYRSNSLQLVYYKKGKSKIRKNGMHHYGIAADIAFLINDKLSYKGDYDYLRKIFKENNLTVLDWELGHVQFIPVSDQSVLREEIENYLV